MNVKRVISCGEPLSPGLRRFLKNVFRAEVVNFYGASESLALGVETEHEEGMILFDDLNLIEVVNGAMYLTSLYNFAQPLIRYRISDHLALKEPPAGNSFTRAEILLGVMKIFFGLRMEKEAEISCIRWPWKGFAWKGCGITSSVRLMKMLLKCWPK